MTVLVTRPSPYGEDLVELLAQQGINSLHLPLIQFNEGAELGNLPQQLSRLKPHDILFVVSQQAVQYADQQLQKQHLLWPKDINYLAIGLASARLLERVTNCRVISPKGREISEHLLELTELQNVAGKTVLILRGNGGRDFLAEQLTARGAHVEFCQCYQRIFIDYQPNELATICQQHHIETVIITSAEMLQRLFTLVEECNKPWLINLKLIVVSERIALLAYQLGWNHVKIASNADNISLLSALT